MKGGEHTLSRKQIVQRMARLNDIIDDAEEKGDIAALQSAVLETLVLAQMLAVASTVENHQ